MGLTIHYGFKTRGTEQKARKLIQGLHKAALDLPFEHVGEIVEFTGDECDFNLRADDDPYRWLLIQARTEVRGAPDEKRADGWTYLGSFAIAPEKIIAFETLPGEGCEAANFGLCKFPAVVVHPQYGSVKTKLGGSWTWRSFCKTQYANDPEAGGITNFLRCHLSVIALLEAAKSAGILDDVSDEGGFWEQRSIQALTKEIGEWDQLIAAFGGMMKDIVEGGEGGAKLEAPITNYSNFERLEAEGQNYLPAALKALAHLVSTKNNPDEKP